MIMYVDEHWYRPRGMGFVPERINLDFTPAPLYRPRASMSDSSSERI
jgi:hypothetical protein